MDTTTNDSFDAFDIPQEFRLAQDDVLPGGRLTVEGQRKATAVINNLLDTTRQRGLTHLIMIGLDKEGMFSVVASEIPQGLLVNLVQEASVEILSSVLGCSPEEFLKQAKAKMADKPAIVLDN